jgi:membrane associated rhomboid family serine protease
VIGVEVHRSRSLAACEERALVLRAVGIASEVAPMGDAHALYVALEDEAEALRQLEAFARENTKPPVRPRPILHHRAWVGVVAYVTILVAVAWLASVGAGGHAWFDAGRLEAGLVRSGEWWRAVTALMLHLDVAHLLSNLGFGSLFGYFCGQLLGSGFAWAAILAGGTLGNIVNALIQSADHRSVGASTAVFAALGLLASASLRLHMSPGQSWAYRWGPLIAAIALLGFTGTGGENTDVTAHATGFLCGAALGWIASRLNPATLRARRVQVSAGAVAFVCVVLAWGVALSADRIAVN